MPKRLSKEAMAQEIHNLWMSRLCTFGLKQAKKMVWGAYVELRQQERDRKEKHGKRKHSK